MSGEPRAGINSLSAPASDPLRKLARAISNFTAPPFLAIPTYIIVGLHDQEFKGLNFWLGEFLAITFGVTLPVVTVGIMFSLNKLTDMHIPIREQRNLPYLLSILSYAIGTLLLWLLVGSGLLLGVMLCYTVNVAIVAIINLGWKISAHATGVGGPLAALTVLFGWAMLPLFLLMPIIGWARVYLKAHTLGQVVAGSIFGYGFTLLQLLLIFKPLGWF
jgi:membrane-associated phospholipid phosphatase